MNTTYDERTEGTRIRTAEVRNLRMDLEEPDTTSHHGTDYDPSSGFNFDIGNAVETSSVFCRILAVSPWSRYGTPDSPRTANSTEYCLEALLGGRVIQLEVVYRNVYLERNAKIVFFLICPLYLM